MTLGRYRVCAQPGCAELVTTGAGWCDRHRKQARRRAERGRPSASARGYGSRWRKIAAEFLEYFPVCVDCGGEATVPDHDPLTRAELVRRGVPDPDTWEYLVPRCASCHNRKTVIRDGGFGR